MSVRILSAVALAASFLTLATVARAADLVANPTIIGGGVVPVGGVTSEDVDIGVGFEDGAFELEVHDESNGGVEGTEYAPNEVLFHVAAESLFARPAGSQFDFLGLAAGANLSLLPASPNGDLLFLGFAAEEVPAGTFVPGTLKLRLVSVAGGGDSSLPAPGAFSVFSLDAGNPVVHIASSDGISSSDHIDLIEGDHSHFNIGFSAEGLYAITFEASGTLIGGAPSSLQGTYYFQVVIPEPASLGVLAPAAALLLRRRK